MIEEEHIERMRARFADRLAGNRDRIAARTERRYAAHRAATEKTEALTQRWQSRAAAIRRRVADRREAFAPPSTRRPTVFDFDPDWDDDGGSRRR